MDDIAYCENIIMRFSSQELLEFILENPNYLTDHYYNIFARAVHKRYQQLKSKEI